MTEARLRWGDSMVSVKHFAEISASLHGFRLMHSLQKDGPVTLLQKKLRKRPHTDTSYAMYEPIKDIPPVQPGQDVIFHLCTEKGEEAHVKIVHDPIPVITDTYVQGDLVDQSVQDDV